MIRVKRCFELRGFHCRDEVEVSFLRRSLKMERRFLVPDVEDIGTVPTRDIHAVLPRPKGTGTTSRTKSGIVFDINFSHISLW